MNRDDKPEARPPDNDGEPKIRGVLRRPDRRHGSLPSGMHSGACEGSEDNTVRRRQMGANRNSRIGSRPPAESTVGGWATA